MNKLTTLLLFASSIAINVYSQTISLDKTFGQNGRMIIPSTTEISFFDFDNHGNIIAAGYALKSGGNYDLTITKTNADGIIDESFGNGGVSKVTDYDQSSPRGLKITNDNKIVVIGKFTKVQFQGYETLIMRFNENGTVDENFGDNGKVNINFNSGDLFSLNCESNDFMLLGRREGETTIINGNKYYTLKGYSISKIDYNGYIDENFGDNGKADLPNYISPNSIKILNDGSIAIAGTYNQSPNTELGFCKLTSVGKLDKDFANDGVWHMNIMKDFDLDYESFSNILEDNRGNLILSGWGYTNSLGWRNRAFLSKFSYNGILDTDFGENGFYGFDFSGNFNAIFQIGDKYVTVGWGKNQYKIIYVNIDGSFGDYVYTCGLYYFRDMKLQGRLNKIIFGGSYRISDANSSNFAMERVNFDFGVSIKSIENNSDEAMIFPNPAKESLYFDYKTSFEIIDIQGKILLKSETPVMSVDIGNLGAGMYFVS